MTSVGVIDCGATPHEMNGMSGGLATMQILVSMKTFALGDEELPVFSFVVPMPSDFEWVAA